MLIEQVKDNLQHNFHRFWFMEPVAKQGHQLMKVEVYTLVSPKAHLSMNLSSDFVKSILALNNTLASLNNPGCNSES